MLLEIHTHRIHGAGIYTNIGGILMGSMLPYIAAPWILWDIKYSKRAEKLLRPGIVAFFKERPLWQLYVAGQWRVGMPWPWQPYWSSLSWRILQIPYRYLTDTFVYGNFLRDICVINWLTIRFGGMYSTFIQSRYFLGYERLVAHRNRPPSHKSHMLHDAGMLLTPQKPPKRPAQSI